MNTITDLVNVIHNGAFHKVLVCNIDIPLLDNHVITSDRAIDSIEVTQQAVKNGLKLIRVYKEISREIERVELLIQEFPIKMIDNSHRPISRISLDFTRDGFEVVVPFEKLPENSTINEIEVYLREYKKDLKKYKKMVKKNKIKSKKLNKLLNKIKEDSELIKEA